jgi:23S rRNA (adenine2503-C2)-methyltransferase
VLAQKTDIRTLSADQLTAFFIEHGEQKFRGKQVYEWLWNKACKDFDEMSSLSIGQRELLKTHFSLDIIKEADRQISEDGTVKYAFEVEEGKIMEGVLIPTKKRMTACISSQVGCSLACKFCGTGRLKLLKNLTAGEIVDQVVFLNNEAMERYQIPLSNIVLMGMGEPLLNYKNVLRAVELISSTPGLGMSPKRITLSTAGIAKMIKSLADDQPKIKLALSLHAANDIKRSKIMEINDSNNLESLAEALIYYHETTGNRVTFEYIIFDGFNDELQDARELAAFARNVPCKINIIEYNPIDHGEFQQAKPEKVDKFAEFLENVCNLIVNVRRSRGKDIDAACGQLANKNKAV